MADVSGIVGLWVVLQLPREFLAVRYGYSQGKRMWTRRGS